MSFLNCKWNQHYTRKSAKIISLPRLKVLVAARAKSIDDIFEKTKLNSQREEVNEEKNIIQNTTKYLKQEQKFRSVSELNQKQIRKYEYEEDLTTIHNKCGVKVVHQAEMMHNQNIIKQQQQIDQAQNQQIKEIFQSLYSAHQEKRINIQKLQTERPSRLNKIDWAEVKRKLPKEKLGTIYDPTRFQNLYDKFNKQIEENAPHGPYVSFRQFLQDRRNHFFN